MKYALIQVLPDDPPGGVVAGIDGATADHVACVVDMAGRIIDRFSACHDRAGIDALISRLRECGAVEVAIERGDGVLVEALLAAGLTVVVITSRQVKNGEWSQHTDVPRSTLPALHRGSSSCVVSWEDHQPRSRHSPRCGRSFPSVVSLPCPG
jgi:hypothetical protein